MRMASAAGQASPRKDAIIAKKQPSTRISLASCGKIYVAIHVRLAHHCVSCAVSRRIGLVARPHIRPQIAAPKDGAVVSEKINGDMRSAGFAGSVSLAEGVFLEET